MIAKMAILGDVTVSTNEIKNAINNSGVTYRKSLYSVKSALAHKSSIGMISRVNVVELGINRLAILEINYRLLIASLTVNTGIGIEADSITGRLSVNGSNVSRSGRIVNELMLESLVSGCAILSMSGRKIVCSDINLSGVITANGALIYVVACNTALRKNFLNEACISIIYLVSKFRKGNVLILIAPRTVLNSTTLSIALSGSSYNSLHLIPLMVVGIFLALVILTLGVGNRSVACSLGSSRNTNGNALADLNDFILVIGSVKSANGTVIKGISVITAGSRNSLGLPSVSDSNIDISKCAVAVHGVAVCILPRVSALVSDLTVVYAILRDRSTYNGSTLIRIVIVNEHRDSINARGNEASLISCKIRIYISISGRHTADGTTIEPEAISVASRLRLCKRLAYGLAILVELYVVLVLCRKCKSRLFNDHLFTGRSRSLNIKDRLANRADLMSLLTVNSTSVINLGNLSAPLVSSLAYNKVRRSASRLAVERGRATSVLTNVVSLGALLLTGSGIFFNLLAGEIVSKLLKARNDDLNVSSSAGDRSRDSNYALNYVSGLAANSTLCSTGSSLCTVSGSSDAELNPAVTCTALSSLNDNLGIGIAANRALNGSLTVGVAVGSESDVNNLTYARLAIYLSVNAIVPSGINLAGSELTVGTILICTPNVPSSGILAGETCRLIVSKNMLTRLDSLGNISTVLSSHLCIVVSIDLNSARTAVGSALAIHNAVLKASRSLINSPLAPRMLGSAKRRHPVGKNGSVTGSTPVERITPLATLRSDYNGLAVVAENRRISRVCRSVLFGSLAVSLIAGALSLRSHAMIVRSNGSLCENGNNAAYAHHDGKEKSTNSFRIVLH